MLAEKKIKINDILFLSFIMLFAANVINRYFYFIYIATIFYIMVAPCNICANRSMAALSIFAASLIVFDPQYLYSIWGVLKPVTFPIAYVLGYNYVKNEKQNKEKQIIKLIVVMVVGMFIHVVLNYRINIGAEDRTTIDVWTGGGNNATLQAAMAVWPLAFCISALFSNVKLIYKVFAITGVVIVLLYNMILAGRTLLVISAILVLISIVFMLFSNSRKRNRKNIILLIAIVLLVVYIFSTNAFGVQKVVMKSNFYERFFGDRSVVDIDEDSRMANKERYINNMLDYPFGGNKLREQLNGAYAHDLYLDVYSVASLFAFVAIIIYILISIINFLEIIKNKSISFSLKEILMCIYLVSNIMFFMEPITAGMPWFLVSYCIMDGMVSAILKDSRKGVEGDI